MNILEPKNADGPLHLCESPEMELLKATDTMVVHNPESNWAMLADASPPTMEIYRKGIVTGLGTDGYTHDMLESMKVANVLHKHNSCNSNEAWAEVPGIYLRAMRPLQDGTLRLHWVF